MNDFTKRGKASVITSDVEVRVFCKEQLQPAINWLIDNDWCFEWHVTRGDSLNPDIFTLVVEDMCWANNLEEFAKVLKQSDYGGIDE